MNFDSLKPEITRIIDRSDLSVDDRLTGVCELIQTSLNYYDWVGFYFANHANRTLHLKAFAGESTDHTVIPFGKGICGQVAESNENFLVPDVKAQDNYIACSIHVKAEIVVPLFKDGKNIGQIDIDSHSADAFNTDDERFLEWVNEKVAEII
ncbi:MAG: GAF domain-containing protein [Bacteroidia bacterium]|nr:GAF domain-containing protein [Bacteroidia bacterium]NNF32165.1 GAF domain-containing protein [Flavobacteriaceae bacterium]MBT8276628.1 GAF domain-containing protein [Bacteroidia bacterium]NNJ80844.1 GAF domain-containing protein [Flavobacteriaceae bacterium]NNK55086.1 GAF domain-containing protein [Flavobacteriaceae bacterium]